MSTWQTMDSAPDQKWLLGWAPDLGCMVVKRVEPNSRGGQFGEFVWATPDSSGHGLWAEDLVTHWMPLPSPPADTNAPKETR
jgi:hypothetical protein